MFVNRIGLICVVVVVVAFWICVVGLLCFAAVCLESLVLDYHSVMEWFLFYILTLLSREDSAYG